MSDLSSEHLAELTELVNQRLKEFTLSNMPILSGGIVRVTHDVVKKWYQEKEESWAMQRISDVTITAEMAMKLSEQGYEMGRAAAKREVAPTNGNGHEIPTAPNVAATPGPEHALNTPLKTGKMARGQRVEFSLGDPVELSPEPDLARDAKADQLREVIHELQDMAVDEVMPTMAFWDNAKPPHLPKAQAILARHLFTWNRLAEYARLEISARSLKGKSKVDDRVVAGDANGDGES